MFKKGVLFPAVLLLLSYSCNSPEDEHAGTAADTPEVITTTDDSLTQAQSSLIGLAEFAGQYPSDVQLFDNDHLNNRIKAIMGPEYENFRKFWQTETPILMEDGVLFTTGCEQHNCAANQYILQVDLKADNVNVFHIHTGVTSFVEKGHIHLPPGLAKEFSIIKGNARPEA